MPLHIVKLCVGVDTIEELADWQKKRRAQNPYLLKKVEDAIIALEAERDRLLGDLGTEHVYRDAEALRETQLRLAEVERDLEDKNAQWEGWA